MGGCERVEGRRDSNSETFTHMSQPGVACSVRKGERNVSVALGSPRSNIKVTFIVFGRMAYLDK